MAKQSLTNYLIEQCKNPTGFVGQQMIKIWNRTFWPMTQWGLYSIKLHASDHLLEIGCGGGNTLHYLTKQITKGQIAAIDISLEAVKKAKKKNHLAIQQGWLNIEQAAAEQLPHDKACFNKVIAVQTHFYWDNLEVALDEIYRVLKPDGLLTFICEKDKINYHLPAYQEKAAMEKLLVNKYFVRVEIYETPQWIQYNALK